MYTQNIYLIICKFWIHRYIRNINQLNFLQKSHQNRKLFNYFALLIFLIFISLYNFIFIFIFPLPKFFCRLKLKTLVKQLHRSQLRRILDTRTFF